MLARAVHDGTLASSPHVVVCPPPGSSSIHFSSRLFRCYYCSAILACPVGSSWCSQLWQKIDPFSVSSPCLFLPEAKNWKHSWAKWSSFVGRAHCESGRLPSFADICQGNFHAPGFMTDWIEICSSDLSLTWDHTLPPYILPFSLSLSRKKKTRDRWVNLIQEKPAAKTFPAAVGAWVGWQIHLLPMWYIWAISLCRCWVYAFLKDRVRVCCK